MFAFEDRGLIWFFLVIPDDVDLRNEVLVALRLSVKIDVFFEDGVVSIATVGDCQQSETNSERVYLSTCPQDTASNPKSQTAHNAFIT